jgi:hypothetical protein
VKNSRGSLKLRIRIGWNVKSWRILNKQTQTQWFANTGSDRKRKGVLPVVFSPVSVTIAETFTNVKSEASLTVARQTTGKVGTPAAAMNNMEGEES